MKLDMRLSRWPVVMIAAVLVMMLPAAAMAIHAVEGTLPEVPEGGTASFALHGSVGMLDGEAHEYVYLPQIDHKMSELIWDLSGITMAGVVGSINFYNVFRVNAGYWTAMTEGDGGMEDYDWYLFDRPDTWTHQSIHNVKIVGSSIFDLNVSAQLYAAGAVAFRGMIGIKRDYWQWEDAVLEFTYSSLGNPMGEPVAGYSYEQINPNAIRDLKVQGDGSRAIDYEQTFTIPYIGASMEGTLGGLRVNGYLTLSVAVAAEDADVHRLREIHFKETFENGGYVGIGASALYNLSDSLYAMVSYEYQSIPETTGDMEIAETGEKSIDAAGISNEHTTLSASVGMAF